jgi:hypothetical protein
VPDGAEVKEYLAEILPHRTGDKADVFWFRPNPKKGLPGITVKRVVDLATGKQVGEPAAIAGYPAPLTQEEREQAVKLARELSEKVKAVYAGVEDKDVEATALFEQVTAANATEGKPGDRVAILQVRRKGSPEVASVAVNLTQETVRDVK